MIVPGYVDILKNQHFECENRTITILKRTHDCNLKGWLYLLDYNNHQYVSNLKHIKDNVFIFDIRGGGKYNLILNEESGNFKIERLEA